MTRLVPECGGFWHFVRGGPTEEPPIENSEYLQSFYHYTSWFRIISAEKQRRICTDPQSGLHDFFSAAVDFYEIMGMFFEDVVCNLASWAAWERDPALRLADLLKRITVKPNAKLQTHNETIDELCRKDKCYINPSGYLGSLAHLPGDQILQHFGIAWKRCPSRRAIPDNNDRNKWNQIAERAQHYMSVLSDPGSPLLTATYNKLKHGPQVVVMSLEEALDRRGLKGGTQEWKGCELKSVRLLQAGARTQENKDELQKEEPIAPFLIQDRSRFDLLFHQLIWSIGVWVRELSYWLLRLKCKLIEAPQLERIHIDICKSVRPYWDWWKIE